MTGRDLKLERVRIDLKQIELAVRTGIPRERLSRFENGWQNLLPDELRRVSDVLDSIRTDHARADAAGDSRHPFSTTEAHR